MRKYVVGAFGNNNIGDEAIYAGVKKEFPDDELIQIYLCQSNEPKAIQIHEMINGSKHFEDSDELIIGGGGLLYALDFLKELLQLVKLAKAEGMKVTIRKIGTEMFKENYIPVFREILSHVDSFTVRSTLSRDVMHFIGVDPKIEKDFAYNLKDFETRDLSHLNIPNNERTNVGFVLAGHVENYLVEISEILTNLIDHTNCNIIIIPHTYGYGSLKHDIVIAELIRKNCDLHHNNRHKYFSILPYQNDPIDVLNTYKKMDCILGIRYHSFIFSDITETPLFGLVSDIKYMSFFKDNPVYLKNYKYEPFPYSIPYLKLMTKRFVQEL